MAQFWILDFGFWILDFGFWILDFGFWISDFGFWILDFGFWISDFGFRISDFGFWISDFGFWISDFGFGALCSNSFCADFGFRILDFGFWISDFGFWILDFGFRILDFGFWISDFGFRILDFGFGFCYTFWTLHKIRILVTPTRVGGFPCHADSGRRILIRIRAPLQLNSRKCQEYARLDMCYIVLSADVVRCTMLCMAKTSYIRSDLEQTVLAQPFTAVYHEAMLLCRILVIFDIPIWTYWKATLATLGIVK